MASSDLINIETFADVQNLLDGIAQIRDSWSQLFDEVEQRSGQSFRDAASSLQPLTGARIADNKALKDALELDQNDIRVKYELNEARKTATDSIKAQTSVINNLVVANKEQIAAAKESAAVDLAKGQQFSETTKKLIADANTTTTQLKQINEAVGNYRDNVGNYTNSVHGALQQSAKDWREVYTSIRALRGAAYIIGDIFGLSYTQVNIFRLAIEHAAQAIGFYKQKQADAAKTTQEATVATEGLTASEVENVGAVNAMKAATTEQVVINETLIASNEEVAASWAAAAGPLTLIIGGIILVGAAISGLVAHEDSKYKLDNVMDAALDGRIIKNKEVRATYDELSKSLSVLNDKVNVANGTMSEWQAKLNENAHSYSEELHKIEQETAKNVDDANGMWRQVADSFTGFGASVINAIDKVVTLGKVGNLTGTSLAKSAMDAAQAEGDLNAKLAEQKWELENLLLIQNELDVARKKQIDDDRDVQKSKNQLIQDSRERALANLEADNDAQQKKIAIDIAVYENKLKAGIALNSEEVIAYDQLLNDKKALDIIYQNEKLAIIEDVDGKAQKAHEKLEEHQEKLYDKELEAFQKMEDEKLKAFEKLQEAITKSDDTEREREAKQLLQNNIEAAKNKLQADKNAGASAQQLIQDQLAVSQQEKLLKLYEAQVEYQKRKEEMEKRGQDTTVLTAQEKIIEDNITNATTNKTQEEITKGIESEITAGEKKSKTTKTSTKRKGKLWNFLTGKRSSISESSSATTESSGLTPQQQTDIKNQAQYALTMGQITQAEYDEILSKLDKFNAEKKKKETQSAIESLALLKSQLSAYNQRLKKNLEEKNSILEDDKNTQEAQNNAGRSNNLDSVMKQQAQNLATMQKQQRTAANEMDWINILQNILSGTPRFAEGTADTGTGGNIDSKGGFLATLHPQEAVIPAAQNKSAPGLAEAWIGGNLDKWLSNAMLPDFKQIEKAYVENTQLTILADKLDALIGKKDVEYVYETDREAVRVITENGRRQIVTTHKPAQINYHKHPAA